MEEAPLLSSSCFCRSLSKCVPAMKHLHPPEIKYSSQD